MSFADFHGNSALLHNLRSMLQQDRLPHALIIAGAPGSGKYTLAQMIAKTLNCVSPPTGALPDFCGRCIDCTQIAAADDLESRCAEAVEARDNLKDADKREARLLIQTHPEVLIIPPDPPQMMIKVDQVRRVTHGIYLRPNAGRRRVYIFTDSGFMKEAGNALLKVLEEPPEFATLILLTANAGELLPTIRSRSMLLQLAPVPSAEIEADLKKHRPKLGATQRSLIASLSEGAIGRARSFDLDAYLAIREHAFTMLRSALKNSDHSELFKVTEGYRAGAEGKQKTEALLEALYGLLRDLVYVKSGQPELLRNRDAAAEITRIAEAVDFDWITAAAQRLGDVESGMRRNLLRSLSLDAFAVSLET